MPGGKSGKVNKEIWQKAMDDLGKGNHEARSTAPNVYKNHEGEIGRILDAEM